MFLLYLSILLPVFFLPGYLLHSVLFRAGRKTPSEAACGVAFALSLPLIAAMQLLAFLLPWKPGIVNASLYGISVVLLYAVARIRKCDLSLEISRPLLAYLVFCVYSVLLLTLAPAYAAAYMYDWGLYYPNVFFYLRQAPSELFAEGIPMEYLVRRTPCFSLVNAFFLSLFGNTWPHFQLVSTVLNTTIFWAVWLAADSLCGRKTARFAILLLPFAPIVTCRVLIPTPKPLSAYLLILTLIAYRRIRENTGGDLPWNSAALFGLLAATSYMVHPMSLLYLGWLGVDYVYICVKRRTPPHTAMIVCGTAAILLVVAPWFAWALHDFGLRRVLIPSYTISENPLPWTEYALSRVTILASTLFIPGPLLGVLLRPGHQPPGVSILTYWGHPLLRAYLETFLAGYTFSGGLLFAWAWARKRRRPPPGMGILLCWSALGAATCLSVHLLVDHKGLAFNIMAPLVTIFFIHLCHQAAVVRGRFAAVLVVMIMIEFAFVRWLAYRLTLAAPKPGPHLFDLLCAAPIGRVAAVAALLTTAGVHVLLTLAIKDRARPCPAAPLSHSP